MHSVDAVCAVGRALRLRKGTMFARLMLRLGGIPSLAASGRWYCAVPVKLTTHSAATGSMLGALAGDACGMEFLRGPYVVIFSFSGSHLEFQTNVTDELVDRALSMPGGGTNVGFGIRSWLSVRRSVQS